MAKPQPIIYLPPSNALVPTQDSSAVISPFIKKPTQLRRSIAWHYMNSIKPASNTAEQTHAHKVSKSTKLIKKVKQTKAKHTSVKAKQHKSHHHKQKEAQKPQLKKNYENFRTAVLKGRHRPIA